MVLGVVVEADRARLNTSAVTDGATVYDGDCFSTEAGGLLFLQGRGAVLELTGDSVLTVRSSENGPQGTEAELSRGTLVFRAEKPTALDVVAHEARIRPASESRTIGQVSVLEPNELHIYCAAGIVAAFLSRGNGDHCGGRIVPRYLGSLGC